MHAPDLRFDSVGSVLLRDRFAVNHHVGKAGGTYADEVFAGIRRRQQSRPLHAKGLSSPPPPPADCSR